MTMALNFLGDLGVFLQKTLSLHFNLFTPMRDSFLLIHTQKEKVKTGKNWMWQQSQSPKSLTNAIPETARKEGAQTACSMLHSGEDPWT